MIPQAFITEWRHAAPWQHPDMIEQDLLISRALVSLFQDTDIRAKLAFRGGTALYKLHVVPATRYSEDIDLVQVTGEPIGPLLDRIHQVLDPWLGMPSYRLKQNSSRLVYRFPAESNAQVSLRLKVEINTREHVSYRGLTSRRLRVASTWFTGEAEITTFPWKNCSVPNCAPYFNDERVATYSISIFVCGTLPRTPRPSSRRSSSI
jgi:predicted nucleotidyltransferase component of viral defense system